MRKALVAVIVLSAAALASVACGSEGTETSGELFSQVADTNFHYTEDNLVSVDFKVGKKYDVEGLTGARSALHGFWRIGNLSVEYEARFYDSHEEAVSLGTSFAVDGSGETAALGSDEALWPEGTKDRRVVYDWRNPPGPKYGTYVIRSNLILLCEGKDVEQGREHCSALLDAIDAA